jgi:diaminopimelate epimerase
MRLSFTKMHGLGNDFVVVDATRQPFRPTAAQARRIADRRLGIGCDQIAVVDPPPSPAFDFGYRVYNHDGSESGMSGNGARCVARFIRDRSLSARNVLRLKTRTSEIDLHLLADGQVRVNMGAPRFEPRDIPFKAPKRAPRYELKLGGRKVAFGSVSMGNPHAVIEVKNVERAPVEQVGAALQGHRSFAESVNVEFMRVIDKRRAQLRIYERGAGETPSSGTCASGAYAVGRLWGKLGPRVEMQMRGGILKMDWAGEGEPLWMTGPAVSVFDGELDLEGEWGRKEWRS